MKAARAGGGRARAALVRSLQDRWFRYALTQLLSVSAARDATQEAGLRALQQLSAYDGSDPPDVWALGVAVGAVRDVRARSGAAPPLLAAARAAGLSADPPRFRRQLTDAADGLSAVLVPLTDDQRAAVTLRAIGGRPVRQVAALLGVDVAVVRADTFEGLAVVDRTRPADRRLRATLDGCRQWSALARYPGDLRAELFRAHRPGWLVPAALATLAASVVLVAVGNHFHPPTGPATQPATPPATQPAVGPPAGT